MNVSSGAASTAPAPSEKSGSGAATPGHGGPSSGKLPARSASLAGKAEAAAKALPPDPPAEQSKPVGKSKKSNIKLTPHHLYVAYIWYLKQRDAEGIGRLPGEEESFCLKCKDGGDVLLCDYGGCTKAFHMRCCGLKTVPEGIWECPRHRCVTCGAGPSHTDAQGRPRKPDTGPASTLWACRACPMTYCEKCLPEEVTFAGDEIVCQACQALLCTDMSALQRDLIKWKPEMFMARPEAE